LVSLVENEEILMVEKQFSILYGYGSGLETPCANMGHVSLK